MMLRTIWLCLLGIGLASLIGGVSSGQDRAARHAVPPESTQKTIRAQLEDTLGISKVRTNPQKQSVARRLMEMASDANVAPDELYVILQVALPLITETGDYEAHQLATIQLTESFSADPRKDQIELLLEYITKCKSTSALNPAVEKLIEVAMEEGQADRFADFSGWLGTASRAAKKHNVKSMVDRIAAATSYLSDRKSAYESQARAQEVLKSDPENAIANLAVGQWLAVFQGDWSVSLHFLAKGSDPKWQVAAQTELTGGLDADSQLKIADAWYEVAQIAGPLQMTVRQRALDAYDSAELKVTSPIAKLQVSKRKGELAKILKTAPVLPKPAPRPVFAELPVNESIEMLKWVKLPDHNILGSWKRDQDRGLVNGAKIGTHRFMVPVSVAGNYQLNMRYVRASTDPNTVALIVPVKDRLCDVYFDAWYGTLAGIQFIEGREGAKGAPGTFEQAKPYSSQVEHEFQVIVHQSEDSVEIQTSMDGAPLVTWTGKPEHLSLPGTRAIPLSNGLGLSVWGSEVAVKSWKLRLLPGGRAFRLGDDWKNPLLEVAKEPPAEVLPKCFDWKGKKYLISEAPLTLPDAQALARRVRGRLLTISSTEEEAMVNSAGQGRILWMSGWCCSDRQWRDERNRPLKFEGTWYVWQGVRQPDNSHGTENHLRIVTGSSPGWDDITAGLDGYHACIEWGEE